MVKAESGDLCGADLRMAFGSCERKATIIRDGIGYCWQHDPERRRIKAEQKRADRLKRYTEEDARLDAEVEHRLLLRQAGLENVDDDTLRSIIEHGGIGGMLQKLSWC